MTDPTAITPADIEAKFRSIQGQVDEVQGNSKKKLVLLGSAVAALTVLAIYVVGRRAGKRNSTVLEIRRL